MLSGQTDTQHKAIPKALPIFARSNFLQLYTSIFSLSLSLVLHVAYWHVDKQGQIVRIDNCLKSKSLCNKSLTSLSL